MNAKTLYKISYGMYVVSSKKEDGLNGQIVNTVFQTTSEPPTIAVCINKQNLTHEYIEESGVFTASILTKETPMTYIGHFGFKSGREFDKFKDIKHKIGVTGAPIALEHTIGYLEAEVINNMDTGSHTLFVGRVVDAETITNEEPMTYAYYHEVKRGKAPKAAPTYIKEESQEAVKLDKYECAVCGYVYNPEEGDPDAGIKPGTPFEELPDDWVCPVCGATKDQFEKVTS
ncbi:MAG TPA: flavin reductase [Anaerolineae bacterium]|jgi:flavin reductase (DIM6/NTAB) family NADH-FMN oxidoreductase RutF/rubredoxin|nr:flavin reductase [Anaerolineae bacterium]